MLKTNGTRNDLLRVAFLGWLLFMVSGCGQMTTPDAPTGSINTPETPAIPNSPTQGEAKQMTPSLPTPEDPGLQSLVEKAKSDLGERLSISLTQINLVEMTEVEWSDSSLGCPQPGMDYLQVITPGYLILLEADAQTYEYHSNRDTYFVYCENQSPPLIPKP
jgi:hypothetical protein